MSADRVYVFDADGVLIEPWGFAEALQSDYEISRDQTRAFFMGPFVDCLLGKSQLEFVLAPWLDRWEWPHSVSDFIELWMVTENRPRAAVIDIANVLRDQGFMCCVASNQEQHRASYIRNEMGFGKAFDNLYFSSDLGAMKPAYEFYEAIGRDLEVQPSSIHFWDDATTHVKAAADAGWNAYLYENIDSVLRMVSRWRSHLVEKN